jgi:phage shock protein C
MTRRLERSTKNKVISGICGGLGEYLQVDPNLVRAVFVLATIMSAGLFLLGYIALLFLIPLPEQRAPIEDIWPSAGWQTRPASDVSDATGEPSGVPGEPRAPRILTDPADDARRQRWIGYALIGLGALFLLGEVGAFRFVRWDVVWPLAIVGLGLFFVLRRDRS